MKKKNIRTFNTYLLRTGVGINEKNDCVVRAFASVFDIDYLKAHNYVKKQFNRKDFEPTYNYVSNIIRLKGKLINGRKIGKTISRSKNKYTVNSFIESHPQGFYLINVKEHLFTIRNGIIYGNKTDGDKLCKRILNYTIIK